MNNCTTISRHEEYLRFEKLQNSAKLSKRQVECLVYMAKGYTAKETAKSMGLSSRTVEYYIACLKNKLGCHKRSELIAIAFKRNICNDSGLLI